MNISSAVCMFLYPSGMKENRNLSYSFDLRGWPKLPGQIYLRFTIYMKLEKGSILITDTTY